MATFEKVDGLHYISPVIAVQRQLFLKRNALVMGTWSTGSFGNDSAGDWVMDLAENPTFDFIRETLQASIDDPSDAMNNENAVAAAEVLCILDGKLPDDYPEVEHNLRPAIETLRLQEYPTDLKGLALKALMIIETDSELKELWENDEAWMEEIRALKGRLGNTLRAV